MLSTLETLAHAGHDHTFFLGGEMHHWLWIAVATTAAGFAVSFAVRRWKNR